jgi:uncharacterized BrkB/YihY/UPF0761 family membrane protein
MAYDLAVAAAVFFGLAMFTFAYDSTHLDPEKHGYLQWFFLMLSFLIFGLGIAVMAQAANDDAATNIEDILTGGGLHIFIWPLVFLIFYIVFYFMYVSLSRVMKKKESLSERYGET